MNALTDTGAEAFALADIDWTVDTIRAVLLDASFVPTYDTRTPPNITNADFFSSISSAVVGSPATLTGKAGTAGTLSASNVTFTAVSGATIVRVAWYKWTGVAGTSQVIGMYDTATEGLPMVPNGGNIILYWDTGAVTGVAGAAQI